MPKPSRTWALAWLATLLLSTGMTETHAGSIPAGELLLKERCQRCHAIGVAGASSHPQAPPFRDVVLRYPPETLEEALAEGIVSGHPDMPVISFEPHEIGAIVAYLRDLKVRVTEH